MVISEIPGKSLDKENAVRVINSNNNSMVSFFYRTGEECPYRMVLTQDDVMVTGGFSAFNYTTQTYSASFQFDEANGVLQDLTLNKNLFNVHEFNDEWDTSQNVRIKNIYTTLGVWMSLAMQLPETEFDISARGWWDDAWNGFVDTMQRYVAPVLLGVAVIAAVVATVVAPPLGFVILGGILSVGTITTIFTVATIVATTAYVAAKIINSLPKKPSEGPHINDPEVGPAVVPQVTIKYTFGEDEMQVLPNNNTPAFYFDLEEELEFEIEVIDPSRCLTSAPIFKAYDPDGLIFLGDNGEEGYNKQWDGNGQFFTAAASEIVNGKSTGTIRKIQVGYSGHKKLQFVLVFVSKIGADEVQVDVVINGRWEGITFQASPDEEPETMKSLFIFNIALEPLE
jgi:hypothetical protein